VSELKRRKSLFRFEHEMANSARNWLTHQGLMVKEEFYTPWGICDFVGVSLNRKRVSERLRLQQKDPIGPLVRIEILSAIPDVETGKSTTIEDLVHRYQDLVTASDVSAEIQKLITRKFVRVGPGDRLQKVNGWVPLHKRIVALELKLNRVEDALGQAISHHAFAEESFVGLPAGLAERIAGSQRAESFKSKGVGIVSVGRNGCKVVLHPQARKHLLDTLLQMHCVERFWRTRLKDN